MRRYMARRRTLVINEAREKKKFSYSEQDSECVTENAHFPGGYEPKKSWQKSSRNMGGWSMLSIA